VRVTVCCGRRQAQVALHTVRVGGPAVNSSFISDSLLYNTVVHQPMSLSGCSVVSL